MIVYILIVFKMDSFPFIQFSSFRLRKSSVIYLFFSVMGNFILSLIYFFRIIFALTLFHL